MSTLVLLPRTVDAPVQQVKDVHKSDAAKLEKLGVRTIRDLLLTLPYAWDDFAFTPVSSLVPGQQASVAGTLKAIRAGVTMRQRRRIVEATLVDDAGSPLRVVWFHSPFVLKHLHAGDRVVLAGTVEKNRFRGQTGLVNPQYERIDAEADQGRKVGGMTPRYHLVAGLTARKVSGWVESVLPLADQLEEILPADIRNRHNLLGVAEAVRLGHKPSSQRDFAEARKRMSFADLFELQTAFAMIRANIAAEPATPIPFRQDVGDAFKSGLGFELTEAQRRATRDAFKDMQKATPMNRLLNGDVGSGKTAVAAACAAMAHAAGLQSVVMAPTEILARQHLRKFRTYLEETFPDLKVELLISGQSAAERRRVRAAAASGQCSVLVGTHALIEEDVELLDLGLAIVDEQHRFGTRQRELLRAKGRGRPHFLAMTATPIPRTLALALYGEMALSVIDEMPPGRTPVVTEVVDPDHRARAYELVRQEVAAGHQAFVICPLIEESETVVARSATAEFERLKKEEFPEPLRMGLIHGRLKDKDDVMRRFVDADIQILVATAVVEVGVDVPNATVMMIEGADRFGLAQLHQFRGRVGRGSAASRCLLLADDPSDKSLARLELVARHTDGFELAEEDMRLRGTGELLGARQHGENDAAMAALLRPRLLDEVREEAERIVQADPALDGHPALRAAVQRRLELTSLS